MVHRVARCSVDNRVCGVILPVVDKNGPEVNEGEEKDVCELLQREQEREEVVRDGLSEAVEWMEGMGRKGRRDDPFVVWFVEGFVDSRMVEAAVDPVNEEVGEENEERELDDVVVGEWC